jgi:hypothetical protein
MSEHDEILREILAERQKMKSLPVLATRYSVIETPVAITDRDGNYIPPDPRRVSPFLSTLEDAKAWIKNNPREGYNLSVRTQYLREFTEQRWSSF